MNYPIDIQIESATERDVPVILGMIRSLAEYEHLAHEVTATEKSLRHSLFGPHPGAEVAIARAGADPVGFAVWFHTYSTFLGQRGLHLEDLFVRPNWRGRGIGRSLLRHVARVAVERDCGRLEWSVLDWNASAIGFYRSLGGVPMDDWTVFRVTGAALKGLAG
jgi:GNAT superfamily N-acetyltransferase